MTPEAFIMWLKGFIAASSHYNLTPNAFEELKEILKQVKTEENGR